MNVMYKGKFFTAKMYKCPVCGKKSTYPMFANGCCSDECYNIDFWRNALDDESIIIDGHCYHVCEEPEDVSKYNGFLGFNGQEFKIRKFDSDVIIITHNLWHQGEIPKKFNKQDNAQFVKV